MAGAWLFSRKASTSLASFQLHPTPGAMRYGYCPMGLTGLPCPATRLLTVIPAQAGIQRIRCPPRSGTLPWVCPLRGLFSELDSGLRRNDGAKALLAEHIGVLRTAFQ